MSATQRRQRPGSVDYTNVSSLYAAQLRSELAYWLTLRCYPPDRYPRIANDLPRASEAELVAEILRRRWETVT